MARIRVLPDVPAVDQPFDYLGPDDIAVGTIVRIPFGGRRVRGWVLDPNVVDSDDRELREIIKVVGRGPDSSVIELCRWASWRWSGRLVTILRLASPDTIVSIDNRVPRSQRGGEAPAKAAPPGGVLGELANSILRSEPAASVFATTPTSDNTDIALAAALTGQAIVITPSPIEADRLTRRLRAAGVRTARWPKDWAQARSGATVVGTRGAVFAPAPALSALVVLDEHDPLLQHEGSPTWNAREIAVERARMEQVPCLLVSPVPSLEAYRAQQGVQLLDPLGQEAAATPTVFTPAVSLDKRTTRSGWATATVIDRRGEDVKRTGLFSSLLVQQFREALSQGRQITAVLNRTGRARLLACRSCSSVARCHSCEAALIMPDAMTLVCPQCAATRPPVCSECGSTALAYLRVGVSRAREELEALVRVPVVEVTASQQPDIAEPTSLWIGTSTALRRSIPGGVVAFVDFDQELLAPRYRGTQDALAMIVAASRAVGGREQGGRVIIQTRIPEHDVISAALRSDPSVLIRTELSRRAMLGLPPLASVAMVGGEAGAAYIERLGTPTGVAVSSGGDDTWKLTARIPGLLQDTLAAVERPPGRLRLQVDPYVLG